MIGTTISHYRILEELGRGGMGVVYKAEDIKLHRPVALKVLPRQALITDEDKTRFAREAQAAASLSHPNVAMIHEFDEVEDPVTGGKLAFIAMEYVDGETVKQKIRERPLPIDEVVKIAIATAEGLAEAHGKGIIHRDIKSENVMVTRSGVVKIMDFGLAEIAGRTRVTKEGMTVGTAAYMSPEQALGEKLDQRTDIWSLGVVLYEMITGRLPFAGDYEQAILYRIMNEESEPITSLRSNVPMELERIVNKTIAKNREERYQTIADFIADLKHLQRTTTQLTQPSGGIIPKPYQKVRRWYWLAAVLLVIVVGFLLLRPFLLEDLIVSEPEPVAVIAFVNQTGDPSYDYLREAIPNLLITSLEQSKYLKVMTWERMNDIAKQMGKASATTVDKELAFELCTREGVHTIVIGSYIRAGETFATDVKVLDVATKELLKSASARGQGVQSILNTQIDELSREIVRGVGLSERRAMTSAQQIVSITTNSMEAYKYFLRGREESEKIYWLEAISSLQQAVRLDSTFAMAYLYLARVYNMLANTRERDKNYRIAKEFAAKTSEKERLYIEAAYAGAIDKDQARRYELLKTIAERFPDEKQVYVDLGLYFWGRRMNDQSVEACNKALRLDPNFGPALNVIAYAYIDMGDYNKALEYLRKYASLNPGEPNPLDTMGDMYFFIGDMEAAKAKYEEAIAMKPDFGSQYKLAYILGLHEDYPTALAAVESILRSTPPSVPRGGAHAWLSFYHWMMGERKQAVRELNEAQRLWGSMENRYFVAFADLMWAWQLLSGGDHGYGLKLAEQSTAVLIEVNRTEKGFYSTVLEMYRGFVAVQKGEIKAARSHVEAIEALLPQVAAISEKQVRYESTLFHATLLLADGKADSAISLARQAFPSRPHSLDAAPLASYSRISFYPPLRDVVARAYLQKGQLTEAIAEYERLTTFDPKKEDRRFISPEYHYYLAKLYEQTGQNDKAKREYERFLKIWKNADPDIPELNDARRRLDKLKGTSNK